MSATIVLPDRARRRWRQRLAAEAFSGLFPIGALRELVCLIAAKASACHFDEGDSAIWDSVDNSGDGRAACGGYKLG